MCKNFNPHTREGCDPGAVDDDDLLRRISIHTPVKGVTFYADRGRPGIPHFNPHTREGCDYYPGWR